MREGWHTAKLADLCEFRNGLWKGKKPPFVHVGVIRNTNFRADGSLDDSDIAFLDVEQKQFEKRSLQYGDLILEKSGGGPKQPVGRVVLFNKKDGLYSFSNFTSVIRVLDSSRLDFNYLHRVLYWYYISGATESMQRRSTGIRNLEFSAYKALDIPLPPLPEQKRIVAILDEAFAGIATAVANTEKNIANAKELFEGYLNAVLSRPGEGWTKCILAEVCHFENGDRGKNYPNKSVLVARGRPFVNAGHLSEGRVCVDRMSYIPEDRYQLLGNGKFSPGDILFCLRGSLGKFGVVGPDVGDGAIASSLVIIRPKSNGNRATVRREFLLHYFRSNLCFEMIKRFSGGAAQPNLGARDLAKFEIHCPPIKEQRSISSRLDDYLEDTKRLDQVMRQKLTALTELKQSLLQKAFSGELTVVPQDEIETALA